MANDQVVRSGGVRKCVVVWCRNIAGKKKGYGIVSLHRFPLDPKLRKIWMNRCVKGGKFWKSSTVCSMHFKADAFEGNLSEDAVGQQVKKFLKPDAIPTLFLKKSQFPHPKSEGVKIKSTPQRGRPKKIQQESNEELTERHESNDSDNGDSLVMVSKVETFSSNRKKIRKRTSQLTTKLSPTFKKIRKTSTEPSTSRLTKVVKRKSEQKKSKILYSPVARIKQKLNPASRRKVRFNFNNRVLQAAVPRRNPTVRRNIKKSIKAYDEKLAITQFDPKVLLERIYIPSDTATSTKKVTWEAEDLNNDFDLRFTMGEPTSDPLDVPKVTELIKDAQKALATIDVLICGVCHEVFYFVEEFQNHKDSKTCAGKSVLKCENEEKSQIWGFTLWKTKQAHIHKEKGEEVPTSWEIYQKWTKLQQNEKDLWVTAGHHLQVTSKISTTKYKEVVKDKDKDPLAIEENSLENGNTAKRAVRSTSNDNERHEYNVEKIVGKRFNTRKHMWEYEVKWENYSQETWEPLSNLENCKALVQDYESKMKVLKEKTKVATPTGRGRGRPRLSQLPTSPAVVTPTVKVIKKPIASSSSVTGSSPGSRPQRTSKQKALNQVKAWCGNISDEEEGGSAKRPLEDDDDDEGDSDESYAKKMKFEAESEDTEEEEIKSPTKKVASIIRSYHNGSGKKLPDNVLIPDAKGVVRISQKQLPSLSTGVYIMSRSSGIIKLDPTASKMATSGGQAIVTVSPKIGQTQIRIIKKEDGTKRATPIKTEGGATSVNNINTPEKTTQVKSSISTPKVVQNALGSASSNTVTPTKKPLVRKEPEKVLKKVETPNVKSATASKPLVTVPEPALKTVSKMEPSDDESDDGIEEMEFPTDLPLPPPDSPPGDFVLDPITGKVAGVEYPDPEPEPVINDQIKEPTESIDNIVKLAAADITEEDLKTDETVGSATVIEATPVPPLAPIPQTTLVTTLPTPTASPAIVTTKILSDMPSQEALISANIMTVTTKSAIAPKPNSTSAAPTIYSVVTQTTKSKPSILNTALKNSNILQKTLQSPKARTQPRIINQSVAKPKGTISPIVRPHTGNTPRPQLLKQKPLMSTPKPKFNISQPVSPNVVKHFYSKTTTPGLTKTSPGLTKTSPGLTRTTPGLTKATSGLTRTTPGLTKATPGVTKTTPGLTKTPSGLTKKVAHPQHQKPKSSPLVHTTPVRKPSLLAKTPLAASPAPKPVISMPSLDDEPALVLATPTKADQVVEAAVATGVETDMSTFTLASDDRPMFITGDDGTVYQVAGQNEDGQTILVTQDSDGQQQCLLVTSDAIQEEVEQVEFPAEMYMAAVQEQEAPEEPVVAQFLRTEPLSPGGTCRVVVRLPDGEVMVTQVSAEEYASLSMDK